MSIQLPLLTMATLGGAFVSLTGSVMMQNPLAKKWYPDIPRKAKQYPNWFERVRGRPETGHTWPGMLTSFGIVGAGLVIGRIATSPLVTLLRKRYIFKPNTLTPVKIRTFKGLLYDLCPDVIGFTLPLIAVFPVAAYWKVRVDGPGRFKDFGKQYNPYDSILHTQTAIYDRPTLAVRPLEKITAERLGIARSLFEAPNTVTFEQKRADLATLNDNWRV